MTYNKLTENSHTISEPCNLNIDLMEHQKRAIYAMSQLEINGSVDIKKFLFFDNKEKDLTIETRIGILGDLVGSGKSLMMVALLLMFPVVASKPVYYSSDKYVCIKNSINNYISKGCNILILPKHLVSQWEDFFNYAPSLKIKIFEKNIKVDEIFPDVFIVDDKLSDIFFMKYQNICWNRIIIDEADTIKLKNVDLIANFIWLITGTPTGITVKKPKYLKEIFGKNINWIVDTILVKNENDFIKKSIKLPKPQKIIIKCLTPPELSIVYDFIPNNVIQMINAGNTDQAIDTLNCHVGTKESIYKIITKAIDNSITNKKLEIDLEKSKKHNSIELLQSNKRVNRLKKSIQNLDMRLNSIKTKIKEIDQSICLVCMGEITENPTMLDCCGTIFCFECVTMTSNQNKCPYCLRKINKKSMHVMTTKNKLKSQDLEKRNTQKNKMDVLLEILNANDKKNSKILIFANFFETFEKIKKELTQNKITYGILKGSAKEIAKNIDSFKSGKIKVLMLNASNFGAGLNLQCATDVIIYHRFTKETEEQIIGRAQRLGRDTPLNVYYLIHENENIAFESSFSFDDVNANIITPVISNIVSGDGDSDGDSDDDSDKKPKKKKH